MTTAPAPPAGPSVDRGLRWWPRNGRYLEDAALAALLVAGAVVIFELDRSSQTGLTWFRVALTLALAVGMVWRRRRPVLLTWVAIGAVGLGASELVLPVVLATLALRRRGRLVTGAAVAGGIAYLLAKTLRAEPAERTITLLAGVPNALLLVGLPVALAAFVRTRRDLLRELRERAERAEAEEAGRAERARLSERTRIAREMHDVLAHRISLVVLHAGALEVDPDRPVAEIERAAALIRTTAREALVDLREVLGVLRSDRLDPLLADPGGSLRPTATIADLDRLTAASTQAGLDVRLENALPPSDPPPALLARTAYRVVQEALTNLHKHAPGASAAVHLAGGPGSTLSVEVSNDASGGGSLSPVGGAGLGLIGLRERVELAGGSFTAGPRPDGSFHVRADLPWPVEAAP